MSEHHQSSSHDESTGSRIVPMPHGPGEGGKRRKGQDMAGGEPSEDGAGETQLDPYS